MSQAVACDRQVYDITCENVHNGNHGRSSPLFQDGSNNWKRLNSVIHCVSCKYYFIILYTQSKSIK